MPLVHDFLGFLVFCLLTPWISCELIDEVNGTETTTYTNEILQVAPKDDVQLPQHAYELVTKNDKKEETLPGPETLRSFDQALVAPEDMTDFQPEVSCKNAQFLLKILTVILPLLRDEVPESTKTSYILLILKDLLKSSPEAANDEDIMNKINDLILALEKYHSKDTPIDNDVNMALRKRNDAITVPSGVKSKVVFKYEVPELANPSCTAELLQIINVVQKAIVRLVNNPLCKINKPLELPFYVDFEETFKNPNLYSHLYSKKNLNTNVYPPKYDIYAENTPNWNKKIINDEKIIMENNPQILNLDHVLYPDMNILNLPVYSTESSIIDSIYSYDQYRAHYNSSHYKIADNVFDGAQYLPFQPKDTNNDIKITDTPSDTVDLYSFTTPSILDINVDVEKNIVIKNPVKPTEDIGIYNAIPTKKTHNIWPYWPKSEKNVQYPLQYPYNINIYDKQRPNLNLWPYDLKNIYDNIPTTDNPLYQLDTSGVPYLPFGSQSPSEDEIYLIRPGKGPKIPNKYDSAPGTRPTIIGVPDYVDLPRQKPVKPSWDNKYENKLYNPFLPVTPIIQPAEIEFGPSTESYLPFEVDITQRPKKPKYPYDYKPNDQSRPKGRPEKPQLWPYELPLEFDINKQPKTPNYPYDYSPNHQSRPKGRPNKQGLWPYDLPLEFNINQQPKTPNYPYEYSPNQQSRPKGRPDKQGVLPYDLPLEFDINKKPKTPSYPYDYSPNHQSRPKGKPGKPGLWPYDLPFEFDINQQPKTPNYPYDYSPTHKSRPKGRPKNTELLPNGLPFEFDITRQPKMPNYLYDYSPNHQSRPKGMPEKQGLWPYDLPLEFNINQQPKTRNYPYDYSPNQQSHPKGMPEKPGYWPYDEDKIKTELLPTISPKPYIKEPDTPYYTNSLNSHETKLPYDIYQPYKKPDFPSFLGPNEPTTMTNLYSVSNPKHILPQIDKQILQIIKENIKIVEHKIPKQFISSELLEIMQRLKELLDIKVVTVEEYVNIVNNYQVLIENIKHTSVSNAVLEDLQQSMTNLDKLNLITGKSNVVELTYLVKRPKPLVYQPYYYIKYQLPYTSFMARVEQLKKENPDLMNNTPKLYKDLISVSHVVETSPDLNNYREDDILRLTFNDGTLVGAKVVNAGDIDMYNMVNQLKHINSELSVDDAYQLIRDLESKLHNTPEGLFVKNSEISTLNLAEPSREIHVQVNNKPILEKVTKITTHKVAADNIISDILSEVPYLRSNNSDVDTTSVKPKLDTDKQPANDDVKFDKTRKDNDLILDDISSNPSDSFNDLYPKMFNLPSEHDHTADVADLSWGPYTNPSKYHDQLSSPEAPKTFEPLNSIETNEYDYKHFIKPIENSNYGTDTLNLDTPKLDLRQNELSPELEAKLLQATLKGNSDNKPDRYSELRIADSPLTRVSNSEYLSKPDQVGPRLIKHTKSFVNGLPVEHSKTYLFNKGSNLDNTYAPKLETHLFKTGGNFQIENNKDSLLESYNFNKLEKDNPSLDMNLETQQLSNFYSSLNNMAQNQNNVNLKSITSTRDYNVDQDELGGLAAALGQNQMFGGAQNNVRYSTNNNPYSYNGYNIRSNLGGYYGNSIGNNVGSYRYIVRNPTVYSYGRNIIHHPLVG